MKVSIKDLRERDARLEGLKLNNPLPNPDNFGTSKKPKIRRSIGKHAGSKSGYHKPAVRTPEQQAIHDMAFGCDPEKDMPTTKQHGHIHDPETNTIITTG
jgi:hypothetical protein